MKPTGHILYTGEAALIIIGRIKAQVNLTKLISSKQLALVTVRSIATRSILAHLLATCIDWEVPSHRGLNLYIAYELLRACSATMEKTERFCK